MRIFASCIAFDGGKSGISEYMVAVIREFLADHQVDILISKQDSLIFPLKDKNLRMIVAPASTRKPMFSMFWHLYCAPFRYKLKAYDLVFLPAGNRRLFFRYPPSTAVTFHDLSQFSVPGKYDAFRMFYIRHIIPHYLKKAPAIYAISENTKNDMIRYYYLEPQRIMVNYNGIDTAKFSSLKPEKELREKFGLKRPYLLYISRIEHPGKNHLNLIKAFEMLPAKLSKDYDLVLAGSDWNGSAEVHAYAEASGLKERIKFLGYVENAFVAALYKYAKLYLFPSYYEGFGLPLLEAMYCGVPVLCSSRSSLPEIGGDAVITFDPDFPADIAAKIEEVLGSEELIIKMRERGLERTKDFSWKAHAAKILATFTSQLPSK